jgi:pyruvate/2-oxoglutarate dehydrogenase complex dihydrolipoamide acyltransferase (E2) component
MIYQLVVPGPIEDVEEVRVLEWHREEGGAFEAGTLLVELETHKAVVEVRPEQAGVLRCILCRPGDWRQIGQPLALLSDAPDEALPEAAGPDVERLPVAFDVT